MRAGVRVCNNHILCEADGIREVVNLQLLLLL